MVVLGPRVLAPDHVCHLGFAKMSPRERSYVSMRHEPALQPDYKRLYRRMRTWQETVEDRLDYLINAVKKLEKLVRSKEH